MDVTDSNRPAGSPAGPRVSLRRCGVLLDLVLLHVAGALRGEEPVVYKGTVDGRVAVFSLTWRSSLVSGYWFLEGKNLPRQLVDPCKACRTCKLCRYCNSGQGSCSVYLETEDRKYEGRKK